MDKFIPNIAKQAGKIILEKFGKVKAKSTKSHSLDIVTQADLASNKFLLNSIKKKFPKHGIISEEIDEYQKNSEYIWIIDPLDGTINFSKKIPLFAVLIALAKNNVLQMSAIYDPVHDEMFFAKKDKGAYLNGKKIHCSEQNIFLESLGCFTDRLKEERLNVLNNISKITKGESFSVSSLSSIGLSSAYVASGRRDWFISDGGKIWDYAASVLLLQEAGCRVSNFSGKPWKFENRQMIAGNKYLYSILAKVVR